ncbi:outer membrane insertion C- signal [Reichenbachiella versicolor]|uniref:outer membrane insertion C- signal n=1 Tax=Reichenbachiella versicolor TaxID=1821036 RepID=UPI000D6E067D|nr:outer membrane insertion C- signal [Reichenbachiella versicolor]
MKKIIAILTFIVISAVGAQAQFVSELGIRFGEVSGNNVAIDGLLNPGNVKRIHANVSFGDGFGADALWDFLYDRVGTEEALRWYVGAGPSLYAGNNLFLLGVSGEVGLSYQFNFPMSLSADWRPTFWLVEETEFSGDGFGLNVRFVF